MGSRRDGNKSGKPASPKQASGSKFSSSLSSGFSFKALEEVEEDSNEDLTLFTGKFDKVVAEAHKQKSASSETSSVVSTPTSEGSLSRLQSSKSLDEDRSSPSKKNKTSVFEYKGSITGLIKDKITDTKDKITETISKRLEEFSNDSSPTSESGKSLAEVTNHPLIPDKVDKLDEDDTEEDDIVKVHSAPASLSDLALSNEDDGIEVIESYFGDEPMEDFTGDSGISFRGTAVRNKSKNLKKLVKKSSATVSMSDLVTTPNMDVNTESDLMKPKHCKEKSEVSNSDGNTKNGSHKRLNRQKSSDFGVPWQKIATFAVLLFAFLIIPLPSYISGFIIGIILASAGWAIYIWIIEPPIPKPVIEIPPLDKLPKIEIPQMKEPSKEKGVYKGWMNELMEYNPDDYHINQTHSIYVKLEGSHLRLQRPKVNMPKRAMWDESFPAPQFIHQRHLEIKDSRIFLMPQGLVAKRLWSKKYPICIALAQDRKSGKSKTTDSLKRVTPDDDGFEMITDEKCSNNILYLFARTGQEKEEWYRRFKAAASGQPLGNHILDIYKALSFTKLNRKSSDSSLKHKRQSSSDSISSISSLPEQPPSPIQATDTTTANAFDLQAFAQYMGRLMPSRIDIKKDANSKESTPSSSSPRRPQHFQYDPTDIRQLSGSLICDPQLIWLNSLIGRIFWDFLRDVWWAEKVREKLQKKLSKIHVPYFIEELKVTDIDLGDEIPVIRRAGMPYIDEQGFWVDLDVVYNGGFKMTIETKVNLMKLRKPSTTSSKEADLSLHTSPVTDPDEEDSAESSTDDDEDSQVPAGSDGSSGGASRKFLKYIDKIAQSRYFQQAYDNKYFKKAMEGVSNTPLELTVEVNALVGCLALNILPPPTDRLWYGFRTNPTLSLSAKPKVGEREVTITHITDWIEKKLSTEFQRVFVMPNMDDLIIPILLADVPDEAVPTVSSTTGSSV
ncbi:hypothetical protein SNE40_018590 [Patella caerulea]|uniref:SMP-LTD domain-containing protein n=1 Tax=Patella caerulea TaxID=87958 RepID=A0AAN8J586_PATCE